MGMGELISIVIPVYNAAAYLPRLFDCIQAQTCGDFEVLLVDDGSKDESPALCDAAVKKDHRFRVFHKPNGGSSSARNVGIREAAGQYIGFLDADDYIEPDMYEQLRGALQAHPEATMAQILSCEEDLSGRMITPPKTGPGDACILQSPEEFFTELMLHTGDSSFCTKLLRAEFMKSFRFSEGRLNEDFELLLRMTERMGQLLTVPRLGYHIVLSSESNTRGSYNQAFYEVSLQNADFARTFGERVFPGHEREITHFYLVQAMWFLLHIPTDRMNRENAFYASVMRRLRGMKREIRRNPYLRRDHRRKLILLTHFPARGVRRLHGVLMKIRGSAGR